jgi:micrococcal nuclease
MHFLLVLDLLTVAAAHLSIAPIRSDSLLVRAVIDGDTIDVATVGRVRLLGIVAPEFRGGVGVPLGREARDRLAGLVLHHWVRLERDAGRSGWRAAYVMREDGVFVNEVLVREGLARVAAHARIERLAELERAEREARTAGRGLWANGQSSPRRTVAPDGPARYTAAARKRKSPENPSSRGSHSRRVRVPAQDPRAQ